MIGNLISKAVTLVTVRTEIAASSLNRNENFGDETVTVVECSVFMKKPYESHREFGHGSKARQPVMA